MKLKFNVIIEKLEGLYVLKCVENNIIEQDETIEKAISKFEESIKNLYEFVVPNGKSREIIFTTLDIEVKDHIENK